MSQKKPNDRSDLNIFQRINMVRRDIQYLQKDATITGYKAITHDLVTAAIRPHLIEHGIIVVPRQTSYEILDTRKKTKQGIPYINYAGTYEFDFVNEDDGRDRVTLCVGAMAEDTGDKGPGGAISYATKYALLKMFNIETGEDEESRLEVEVPKYISELQIIELTNLLEKADADVGMFLTYVEAESMNTILESSFEKGKVALNKKLEKKMGLGEI